MSIDTAAKRSSCLDFEEIWVAGIPFPDSIVDQGDRQHLLWSYAGIVIAGGIVPGSVTISDFLIHGASIDDELIHNATTVDTEIHNVTINDESL